MKLKTVEIVTFGMLGALMFVSKALMAILPNIHLLGTIIVAVTVVYRAKALFPIYTYVFIEGIISGFATWWLPYLYIWAILWGSVMLLPKKMSKVSCPIIYLIVSGLHGFLFGILYAPAQAVLFGLDFKGVITWIIAGLPYDITHGISNLVCGILICPIIMILKSHNKKAL